MSLETMMLDGSYVNPELDALMKAGKSPPRLGVDADIHALRAQLLSAKLALTAANTTGPSTVSEEDIQVPMRDSVKIAVRIYRPQSPHASGSPVFVMYHGGGFCLGGLDNEALMCRRWAEEFGGVAVNVDYRLAPEHVFPVPVHDAFDSLKWVAANMKSIGGNPKKGFIIGGISAGGNLSAVISHMYRDERISPPLTGIYLSVPSIFAPSVVPDKWREQYKSREQNAKAPILGKDSMDRFAQLYQDDPTSPLRSPILFPTGHKNFPPTYFQICGMDPLRDEAIIYEKILREESGVRTKVDLYPGLPHAFWSFFPTAGFTKHQQEDSVCGLAWLLEFGEV